MSGPCKLAGVDAVAGEQTLQQMADAGIGLPMCDPYAGAGGILKSRKLMRVMGG